jgi:predicted regulator of Ras-like GTPase activity (Roadblock/LC7/MglB family)
MPDANVRPDDGIQQVLTALIERSGALTALIVTKEGIAATQSGDTSYFNVTALAALVAGMFAATKEVARMVGEHQFSILLQQGENRHIHIGLLPDSRMMVIIFEDFQRIGLVRHEARRSAQRLQKLLDAEQQRPRPTERITTPEFKEYALSLVDRIFQIK